MIQETALRYWKKPPQFTPTEDQIRRARQFNVHPLIVHLLEARNIIEDDAIAAFLHPSLAHLPDPFTMKDMAKAAGLVVEAITSHSDIIIWGDYDVDGITATCLLITFFKKLGMSARWKIPDRFTEGYGLNCKGIEDIRSEIQGNSPLLITVDCGISSHHEIQRAKALGFRILVTDHHEPPEHAVNADAILNVKQAGCPFIDKNLAGVGTAFYLAAGVRSLLKSSGLLTADDMPNLKQFLDFVAIGTIADMVPLTGVNRILVKAGFEVLASASNTGVSALLRASEINGTITSEDIAFQIAPRLNAAGRMGKVDSALEVLLCDDENAALQHALRLSDINTKRKKTCRDILESTLDIVSKDTILRNSCIVISGDFHQGVIGIVASQLVNIFHVPVILFTQDPSIQDRRVLKGSGRSIPGIDLYGILRQCDRFLLKYGGHTMAAGLSLLQENFEIFTVHFAGILKKHMNTREKGDESTIDARISVDTLFEENIFEQIMKLEPFGVGNTRPIFLDATANIVDVQTIGHRNNHLRLSFRCRYANRKGIGFNLAHKSQFVHEKNTSNVVYSPVVSRYKNATAQEIRLIDIF